MRILVVSQNLGIVGGVEMHLRALIPQLLGRGSEIAVLVGAGSQSKSETILSGSPGSLCWIADGTSYSEILREIVKWKPDVIYNHGIEDHRIESDLTARFPSVFFPHNYHGTCISGTKCHSIPEYQTCDRKLGLGCLALYLPRGCGGWNPFTMVQLYRVQMSRKNILEKYRSVIVHSQQMFNEFEKHGVPVKRLRLIKYFPPNVLRDSKPPVGKERSDRILFVGRMTRLKGLHFLVQALIIAIEKLGRPLTLVLAGDGPERPVIQAMVKNLGLAAEFLGWLGIERRMEEMRKADLLAVPSLWPEPFGLVGLEAAFVGLPAVGFAAGGITEWLQPGVTGESAPGAHPSVKELADALVRALKDPEHLKRLQTGAWEMGADYSAESHVSQVLDILEEAAEFKSSTPLEFTV